MWLTSVPWSALVWRPLEWESFKFHTGPVVVYSAMNLIFKPSLLLCCNWSSFNSLFHKQSTSGPRDKSDYEMILYHLTNIRKRWFGLNFLVITGNLWCFVVLCSVWPSWEVCISSKGASSELWHSSKLCSAGGTSRIRDGNQCCGPSATVHAYFFTLALVLEVFFQKKKKKSHWDLKKFFD